MAKIVIFGFIIASILLPKVVRAAAVDCDNNAVIFCGAISKSSLIFKIQAGDGHNSAADIQAAMAGQGIDTTTLNSTDLVDGTVNNQGQVFAGGQMVATDAQSIGRQFLPGSTAAGNFWMRPTSVSFASSSLEAFVNMTGGSFNWAILKSCGNPVVATPVVAQAAVMPVSPSPPAVAPSPPPAPAVTTEATVEQPVATAPLPATGGHSVPGLTGLGITLISLAGYSLFRSRQRLIHALNSL